MGAEAKYGLTLAMAVPGKGNAAPGLRSVWRIGWIGWAVKQSP